MLLFTYMLTWLYVAVTMVSLTRYYLYKVTVVDGPEGAAIVKNLSIHAANGEEAAQALLSQGKKIY